MRATGYRWLAIPALIFGLFIFLSVNWHSHGPKFTYHSELWADRVGYHVYLPAVINYRFDVSRFPERIDQLTGNGFKLDSISGHVATKYTCGVALLRLPFYLVGELFRSPSQGDLAGFSAVDHLMVDISSAFYGTLGITLLWFLLRRRYVPSVATLSVFAVLAGTNLLYYIVADPGMSHVYSFFLFALFITLVERGGKDNWSNGMAIAFGLVTGAISLIRPTNILFLPIGWLLVAGDWRTMSSQLTGLIRPARLILMCAAVLAIWSPQFIYWNYLFGTPLAWSYGSEGFSNWQRPELVPFWFAPYNGLFSYAPLLLIILLGSSWSARSFPTANLSTWLAFGLVSYLSASWFSWTFGCGFGARTMVEYTSLFAFPLAGMLNTRGAFRWPLIVVLILCCAYTLKLMYSYDSCWFGETWDWSMFLELLLGPTK